MPIPSEIVPIERRSARAVVLERLTAWIEGGALEPGELIKDGDVAKQLGVSRTPVREALQILEQRGLVEMEPGKLTRITHTTREDVARVFAPLAVLEALAAGLGTPNATASDIDEMRSHNAQMLAAVEAEDPARARDADREFHAVLVRLADNPYVANFLATLLSHTHRLEALYFRDKPPGRDSHREHEQIVDAVAAGDSSSASEQTRQNFQRHWKPADTSGRNGRTDATDRDDA
jgi:DNA-binding GntR family transcriptional regulator